MTERPPYVVDTNVVIDAVDRIYPIDIFPMVAGLLVALGRDGRLFVPLDVREELSDGSAGRRWLDSNLMCDELDDRDQDALRHVMGECPNIVNPLSTIAVDADPIVVALGLSRSAVVVTNEKWNPHAKKMKSQMRAIAFAYPVSPCWNSFAERRIGSGGGVQVGDHAVLRSEPVG